MKPEKLKALIKRLAGAYDSEVLYAVNKLDQGTLNAIADPSMGGRLGVELAKRIASIKYHQEKAAATRESNITPPITQYYRSIKLPHFLKRHNYGDKSIYMIELDLFHRAASYGKYHFFFEEADYIEVDSSVWDTAKFLMELGLQQL